MPSKAIDNMLDRIDWYSLRHAYGDASDVPVWLRQLYSRDKSVREATWGELFGSIRHQGDVYESSIFIVDLFRQMLFDPKLPAKDELLQALAYWTEPTVSSMELKCYRGRSLEARLNREVAAGWQDYAKLLKAKSARVRIAAAHALSVCLPMADEVAKVLRAAIKAEPSAPVQAELLLRLATLSRPSDLRILKQHTSADESNSLVRLAAVWGWLAIHRANSDRSKAPAAAIEILESERAASHRAFLTKYRHELVVSETSSELASRDVITPLCLKLVKDRDIQTRKWAITHLAESGSEAALAGIEVSLRDKDDEVRSVTAFIVGDRHMKLAVKPLGDLLFDETKPEVRATVLRAIKKLIVHAGPAMDGVAHVATTDDSNTMRNQAWELESLFSQIYLTTDAKKLVRWLDNDENPELTKLALRRIKQLAKDRSEIIAQDAIEELDKASPALVQQWALALQRLGPLKPKTRKALTAKLRPRLQDKFPDTRVAVGNAIRSIDPDGPNPQQVPSVAELKEEITKKAGEAPPPSVVQLIRKLLNDRSHDQDEALWKLRLWGARAKVAMPYLQATLKKPRLRAAAAGTIAWISPTRGRKFVAEMLSAYQQTRRDSTALHNAHVFTKYMPPELHADAVTFMLDCLPEYVVAPDNAALSIVYAIHNFHEPEPDVLMPLLERLLTLAWPNEYRGLGSPVDRVLHFLKVNGRPYQPLVKYVAPWLEESAIQTLALETLSRIGAQEDVQPYIDKVKIQDTPANARYLERLTSPPPGEVGRP